MSAPIAALLVPGFPADETDTACIPALQSYVRALAAASPDLAVAVITFQYPAPPRTYRWHGIEVHSAGGADRRGLRRRATWLRAAAAFRRLRRRAPIAVVHSFWLGECTLVGQWLARRGGIRHVASIMGQDADTTHAYWRQLRPERMTITCGSAFAAARFAAATGRAVDRIVPFGLDCETIVRDEGVRDLDILGVGSLTPLKNYTLFVDLVADLRRDWPGLRAAIIGDGPERASLQRQIDTLGLGDALRLLGELPREGVIDHLFRSRILLHPSLYEGQGYVFLEALHAGLSVVSFAVGHHPPTPRAHACTDVGELRARLRRLMENPPPPERVPVDSITDTVTTFRTLYGL